MYIFLPCVICIFHWFKETLKGLCQWKIEYKINCYLYIGKRFQLSFSWFTWRDVFRRSHRGSLGLLCVWITEERTSLPKANYLEASKESSICNRTKTEFSFPIYVPSKREREESSRWRKAGHRIAHILSALCMWLNCFRVRCSCNIPEMNQRSSRFRPCPPDFWALSHTYMHVCMHVCVYHCVYHCKCKHYASLPWAVWGISVLRLNGHGFYEKKTAASRN